MEFIKKNWKNIALVLLAILFVSKCSSSGNYERKYKKQVTKVEMVSDSLNANIMGMQRTVDSLNNVISMKDLEIKSLSSQLDLSKTQNIQLAKKPTIVRINSDEK